MSPSEPLRRREFLGRVALGASALGLARPAGGATAEAKAGAASAARRPVLMKAGHQHDHSETTLRALAAFGVNHICSGHLGRKVEEEWSVDALLRLRKHVESFGIALDAVPLPMSSSPIARAEMPEILLAKDPERDRAIEDICTMIRHAGQAGIPMVKYNLTFIGVVRTERTPGRGGASLSTFDYALGKQEPPLTEAGRITEQIYWDRIEYFMKRVVPVAEEAKVKIALHPQDPGMPKGTGWRGVETVLGSVDGLKRFVETSASPYHGLNFCQGTVSEMLAKPGEEIYDVIRHIHVTNKLLADTFRLYLGATGANTAGTELFFDFPVAAKGTYDYYCAMKMVSTDFQIGRAHV